jgi:hypothetical protein
MPLSSIKTTRLHLQRQLRALGCQRDRHGDYAPPSDEIGYYVTSVADQELTEDELLNGLVTPAVPACERCREKG